MSNLTDCVLFTNCDEDGSAMRQILDATFISGGGRNYSNSFRRLNANQHYGPALNEARSIGGVEFSDHVFQERN